MRLAQGFYSMGVLSVSCRQVPLVGSGNSYDAARRNVYKPSHKSTELVILSGTKDL